MRGICCKGFAVEMCEAITWRMNRNPKMALCILVDLVDTIVGQPISGGIYGEGGPVKVGESTVCADPKMSIWTLYKCGDVVVWQPTFCGICGKGGDCIGRFLVAVVVYKPALRAYPKGAVLVF